MSRPAPTLLRRGVVATLLLMAVIGARFAAAAQSEIWAPAGQIHAIKNQFVAAVSQLAEALAGTYGDEGGAIGSAIESLDRVRLQWDDAIRVYEKMLAPAADNAEIHVALGTVYLDRYRVDDALREFAAASRLDARRADPYSLSALAYGLANRHEEASQALLEASSRDGSNPVTFYGLAQQLIATGRRDQARDALRTFQELQQKRSGARGAKTESPAPFERAFLLRQAAGVAPIFALHRYREAFVRLLGGDYEQAVAEFRRTVAGDPLVADSATGSTAVGEAGALLRRGQLPLAMSKLEAAVDAAPNRSEAHRMLGVAYWADGQIEKSIAQLNAAIQLVPGDERSRTALADVLVDTGRTAEAEKTLEETIQTIPDSGPAHYRLGQLYQTLSLLPQAARELEMAASLAPLVGLDRLYETIGGLYVNQADFDRAVEAYVKRVDVNPNYADAHRKLGEIYFLQGRDDEALAEFTAALLIEPANSAALAAACQVYLRMGRYAEALETSSQALALDAGRNEARYALATSLLRLGRTEDAKQQLEVYQRTQAASMANAQRQSALKATVREATVRLGNGEYVAAAALLRKALAGDPDVAAVQRDLGIALMKSAQYGEALQALDKALQLQESAEVHQLLADAYRALGRTGESEAHAALAARASERTKGERLRRIGAGR